MSPNNIVVSDNSDEQNFIEFQHKASGTRIVAQQQEGSELWFIYHIRKRGFVSTIAQAKDQAEATTLAFAEYQKLIATSTKPAAKGKQKCHS